VTPRRAEPDVVSRRLRLIEESLRDLGLLADRTAADLAAAPLDRAHPVYIRQVSAHVLSLGD
jgi:hypothetical protein